MNKSLANITLIREIAPPRLTRRVHDVCWQFGVPPRESPHIIAESIALELRPGTLTLLTGPSGAGKSALLSEVAERCGQAVWVGRSRRSTPLAVVDRVAPRRALPEALEILTACGLGEPRLWVRRASDLSDGEKFRADLARAVGDALTRPNHPPIFCDEFTAILHRRLAHAIAYNLRKLVTRHGLTLLVATTHDDIVEDLQPDTHVRLGPAGPCIVAHSPENRPAALRRHARIEPGSVGDYRTFAPMHYRHRDVLGFVDKVFLLRERAGGDPLGIAVFAHGPIELALRNQATAGRFRRNAQRLNREMRILRRLVMHPDVRGCGLGHWFVEQTLPLVGTRFVECLAAMGAVNPVFERAGMTRLGRCPQPRGRLKLLERMKKWNLDPFSPRFAERIRRCPRVRELVLSTIRDWIAATRGEPGADPAAKPPETLAVTFRQLIGEPPMYYLWDRQGEFPVRGSVSASQAEAQDRSSPCRHASDASSPSVAPRRAAADDAAPPSCDSIDRHRPGPRS